MANEMGWLQSFPPDEYPRFAVAEFEGRVEAARRRMRLLGIDAILVTSEANFRYMTGYILQSPVQIARPRYFVLPLDGEPCAIVPKTNIDGMRQTSWVRDLRSWVAPNPADDGLSLVSDALRAATGSHGCFGAELGQESRLGMPVLDLLRLQEMLAPAQFVDAEVVFRQVRMIKSEAEIERIRRICHIVSQAFAELPGLLSMGDTEWSACRRMQLDLVRRGAHRTPHITGVSGFNGYTNINTGPTARSLEKNSILTIDTGCCFDNYWCDFNRNFAFGTAVDSVHEAYRVLFNATEAALTIVKPGRTTSELYAEMYRALSNRGVAGGTVGRMGHGIGLLAPEPPSISESDHTVLKAGMVLTLEPSVSFTAPGRSGAPEERIMVHEENIVVTQDGCELLSQAYCQGVAGNHMSGRTMCALVRNAGSLSRAMLEMHHEWGRRLGNRSRRPIASAIRPVLRTRYRSIKLADVNPVADPQPGEEVVGTDIRSLPAITAAMKGVRRVVHLAAIPDEDAWPRIRDTNIDGTFNVFEAARTAGVVRMVYASSHHVVAFTETGRRVLLDATYRPSGLYGVSKAFGETLANLYSHKFGLSAICLRIAAFQAKPSDYRQLLLWISPRDVAQLVLRSLEAPESVRFLTVFGVSANTRNPYDRAGWEVLGYAPEDNSEAFFGTSPDLMGHATRPSDGFYGGEVCFVKSGVIG